jgi:hypothetical protein
MPIINLSTGEAEAGGIQVQGQSRPHRETLSQEKKKENTIIIQNPIIVGSTHT